MHFSILAVMVLLACNSSSTPNENEKPDVTLPAKSSEDVGTMDEQAKKGPLARFQSLVQEECACTDPECQKRVDALIQELPQAKLRLEKPEVMGQLMAKRLECSGRKVNPEEEASLDSAQAIIAKSFDEVCACKDRECFDLQDRSLSSKLDPSLIKKVVQLRPAFFGSRMKQRNECMAALTAKEMASIPFRFKVPAGYELIPQYQLRDMEMSAGEKLEVAMSKPRAKSEYFKTSVVFTKVQAKDVPATSQALCDFVASAMARELGADAKPAKRVTLPMGETCQFEIGKDDRQAIQTLVYLDSDSWTVTCNFDQRDTSSQQECLGILQSFAAP